MTHSPSRYLVRLEESIAASRDPVERDRLRAEWCAAMIRHERVDEAEPVLKELRDSHERQAASPILPWVNYAEAVLHKHRGQGGTSIEKMRRAHAMSGLLRLNDLRALSAASLAHWFWNEEEIEAAVGFAREALRLAAPDNHAARCRVSVMLGDVFSTSRRIDLAAEWFVRGRYHAVELGDNTALAALAFNLGTSRMLVLRQALLSGQDEESTAPSAAAYWEISRRVDKAFGLATDGPTVVVSGSLLSLQDKPVEALAEYVKLINDETLISRKRIRARWSADQAWCYARLGKSSEARESMQSALANQMAESQVDDCAAMHSYLALTLKRLGDVTAAVAHDRQANELWATYREYQDRCVALCESITVNG